MNNLIVATIITLFVLGLGYSVFYIIRFFSKLFMEFIKFLDHEDKK